MTTIATQPARRGANAPSPIGQGYQPLEHDGFYDYILAAQQEEPVFYAPSVGYWMVTRRDDVRAVLADPDTFSASPTLLPITPLPDGFGARMVEGGFSFQPTLVNSDGDLHQKLRHLATRFMNIKRFHMYEADIRRIVKEHIAAIGDAPEVDLVSALTYDAPAKVLALFLGIDDISPQQIKTWADQRLFLTFGALAPEDVDEAGTQMLDYWRYCVQMVEDRITAPKDDYASALLALRDGDDDVLSLTDIHGLVFGVMLAGHETTTNASGNLIYSLMQNRTQWERLVADPDLVPNAVEEGLRYASSVVNWRRRVTKGCALGGVDLPEGALVMVSLAGANNDPSWFEDPRQFDLDRPSLRQHLAFGHGKHHCIGAPLARLELRIILEELIAAFPRMELAPDFTPSWIRTATFRGLERLDVLTGYEKDR